MHFLIHNEQDDVGVAVVDIKAGDVVGVAVGQEHLLRPQVIGLDVVDERIRVVPAVHDPARLAVGHDVAVGLVVTEAEG